MLLVLKTFKLVVR